MKTDQPSAGAWFLGGAVAFVIHVAMYDNVDLFTYQTIARIVVTAAMLVMAYRFGEESGKSRH